jgi:hypothetical protein
MILCTLRVPELSRVIEATAGMLFPNDVERTYGRSFAAFAKAWKL